MEGAQGHVALLDELQGLRLQDESADLYEEVRGLGGHLILGACSQRLEVSRVQIDQSREGILVGWRRARHQLHSFRALHLLRIILLMNILSVII
jgi:hypothetical protein